MILIGRGCWKRVISIEKKVAMLVYVSLLVEVLLPKKLLKNLVSSYFSPPVR